MAQTVSQAYLLGIREGRAMLRDHEAQCGPVSLTDAKALLANANECCALGFSGDAQEACKGERDFWRNQVKRLAVATTERVA